MALAKTMAVALVGVHAEVVDVEADLSAGLPGVSFTGLADTAVRESRDRIRAAVINSKVEWPNRKITVALLPADVRKVGSRFDLAMAVAVLGSAGQIPAPAVADMMFIAELGLDGRLRPVRGVLPSVAAARARGIGTVVVATGNGAEGALVDGVDVRTAGELAQIIAWLRGDGPPLPAAEPTDQVGPRVRVHDLADVAGQETAKRALEIAAAGGHHLSMVGAPGAGKTMLAQRLPDLLPALDDCAALEVSAVHSVAGLLEGGALIRRPPLQAPHHTASVAALVGGGSHLARPGAISLAHRGVLFLDEGPEFGPAALEALRQPLESGEVVLHRSGGAVRYPARFQLVIAANPCPCARGVDCECAPAQRRRYQHRLSGPLLDRIDVRVCVQPVSHAQLRAAGSGEPTEAVAGRIAAARSAAATRWRDTPWQCNGAAPGPVLRSGRYALPRESLAAAEQFLHRGTLSARGYDRVLRIAWTIADLAGRTAPHRDDVAEALYFRMGEASSWAA